MSCAHQWKIFDKYSREFICYGSCGKCINCLVDWRNSYEDLCNEEAFQRNYCMSFLTLTYDDFHLDWRNDWHGNLVPSLNPSDAVKFVKRVRSYMKRHKIDNSLLNSDFRYVVAGEYGENDTHRPHLHFIFFGLDYRVAGKMFRDCWKYGNLKLLPVTNGCFRYVIGYMHKQVKSFDNPQDLFECHNLVRPFFHHSQGLGKSLFIRQWDFIVSHDYYYKSHNGVLRPVPQYYMRRYRLLRSNSNIDDKRSEFLSYNPNSVFSLKLYNKFKHDLSKIREQNLIKYFRNSGQPVNDSMCFDVPPDLISPVRECRQAIKDYLSQIQVPNYVVVNKYALLSDFIGQDGNFKYNSMYPMYKNYRQVAYDLDKFGDLVPF